MGNFIETYKQGKAGRSSGLTTGIPALDLAINGIQKKTSIGVAAAPKCGKTTFADYSFVISPYLQCERLEILDDVEWIYFSFEIDRVSKEFKFAAFFIAYDYKQFHIKYKGVTYEMNQDYLMGKMLHRNADGSLEIIPVSDEHEAMLKEIYARRIIPIFGEHDKDGNQIKPGKIIFIEEADNPTGMNKFLFHYAKQHGDFLEVPYSTVDDHGKSIVKKRIVGYTPKNPNKFTIIVTDHVRKLRRERGFSLKENIDKWLEYSTYLRNRCGFTFINICHSNRGISNVDRLKYAGEHIYPTADDVKDTGNLAEESVILITLFNPNDEKYNLKNHMGIELKNYPNYRSIHITESRYTECPAHIQTNMFGGVNMFSPLTY